MEDLFYTHSSPCKKKMSDRCKKCGIIFACKEHSAWFSYIDDQEEWEDEKVGSKKK